MGRVFTFTGGRLIKSGNHSAKYCQGEKRALLILANIIIKNLVKAIISQD
jgi:hypothetical protein